jgi:hypothetical protein
MDITGNNSLVLRLTRLQEQVLGRHHPNTESFLGVAGGEYRDRRLMLL